MNFRFLQLGILALLISCCGCPSGSKDVGLVEGVVTLDGKPVDRATIRFFPPTGRPSIGFTDDKGHYALVYTRKQKGALIGNHKVTISTELEADYLDPSGQARKESMPPKYRDSRETELAATVEGGQNEIDFELQSDDF